MRPVDRDHPMRIGMIGLGTMGEPMAANLIRAGTPLVVWNRSAPSVVRTVRLGGSRASSADDLLSLCDVVLVMLADEAVIDQVLGRGGPRFVSWQGRLLVQMATTSPEHSAGLARAVRSVGGRYVEAPVSGSRIPAERGELVAMLAGDLDDVELVEDTIRPMCSRLVRCGMVPRAMSTKLAVNHFLITMVSALAETTHLATHTDLDLEAFADVLDSGPMASAVSRVKLRKLLDGDLQAHSPVDGVHGIARLIEGMARSAGVATPFLELSRGLLAEDEASGHGSEDTAAVIRVLELRSEGLRRTPTA